MSPAAGDQETSVGELRTQPVTRSGSGRIWRWAEAHASRSAYRGPLVDRKMPDHPGDDLDDQVKPGPAEPARFGPEVPGASITFRPVAGSISSEMSPGIEGNGSYRPDPCHGPWFDTQLANPQVRLENGLP